MSPDQHFAAILSRKHSEIIERILVTAIEQIEGRVPSDPEITRFGLKEIHPDGTTVLKWRGIEIASIPPIQIK